MERIEEEQDIDVYIDGSCINNGKINAKAGYGVFFETDDCRNESNVVQGKQTNNTGELTAMIRALEILKKEIEDKRNINIYTDSEYVMKCTGSYGEKLAKNNWKTKEDKIPPNLKLLQKIYELYHGNKKHIKIHHIKAHTNLSDKHSIGNSQADRLANLAVNPNFEERDEDICGFKNLSVVVASSAKNFINVSYTYKDAVKKLGCKWDMNKKKWYYEDNISEENIKSIKDIENLSLSTEKEKPARSNTGEFGDGAAGASGESDKSNRVYIKVAFKNKDAVKKHGCKWDPEKKSWYYFADTDKNKIEEIMKLI
jgi:ribonuclease HI